MSIKGKVIILLGPTGVGKTSASILLAQELNTEIISADSMQIYRDMDIGTAKPSIKERASVMHHMIDLINPSESYSAGKYIEAIAPIIDKLHKKGKIPIIVGGTGLYIKAITRGIFSGPCADWKLRKELLEAEEEEKGCLYSYLENLDSNAAVMIERNDIRRIVRAIEVCLISSEKMSSLQEKLTKPLPYDFIKIGLTRERKELYSIIEKRVDSMIQAGLMEEVKTLFKTIPDKTPMQAIGYKEFCMFFNGEVSEKEAVRLIKRNSKRYAKRQFTWFKKEDSVKWIDISGVYNKQDIFDLINASLKKFYPEVFI